MDTRVLGATAVLGLALLGGIVAFVVMGGDDAPAPADQGDQVADVEAGAGDEAEVKRPKGAKAKAKAAAAAEDPEAAAPEPVPVDEEYLARAQAHREKREASQAKWRTESTAAAAQWVSSNVPDEAKGAQVMAAVTKYHDTIAASRADVEDGVIKPDVMREEFDMAKADFKVELTNLLGAEGYDKFMAETRSGPFGGF